MKNGIIKFLQINRPATSEELKELAECIHKMDVSKLSKHSEQILEKKRSYPNEQNVFIVIGSIYQKTYELSKKIVSYSGKGETI